MRLRSKSEEPANLRLEKALDAWRKRLGASGNKYVPVAEEEAVWASCDECVRRGNMQDAAAAYAKVALAFESEGMFLKAIAAWKRASRLDPMRADTTAGLLRTYRLQGLDAEAKALEEAVRREAKH